jgi:hypothetical protein
MEKEEGGGENEIRTGKATRHKGGKAIEDWKGLKESKAVMLSPACAKAARDIG